MSIQSQVIEILADQALLEPADIAPTDALADLGIDSMALVECIFAFEETFGITIPFNANTPDASGFDLSTPASIAEGLQRLITEQTQEP